MKRLGLFLLVILLGCDTPRIISTAVPGVDFTSYKTFQISESQQKTDITHPAYDNPENREIMLESIRQEMTKLGYEHTSASPDLLVVYKLVITDMVDPRYDSAVIYKPWVDTKLDTFNYTEGLTTIQLIDFDASEMIWQGSVTGILVQSPDKFQQRISKDVAKIFATLPSR